MNNLTLKKGFTKGLAVILLASSISGFSISNKASASTLPEENNGEYPKLISTEQHTVEGETFNLEQWQDENGLDIYTIDGEIQNKEAIFNYTDELLMSTPKPTLLKGSKYNWSKNLSNTDKSGKTTWKPTGYSEKGYLYPATQDAIHVNNADFTGTYTGSGNADKI
ncbi:hypothetical protein, partial [Bacillus sp. JJ722]|uniref:hypothetical protein n=1 Tax=Bacillus sp. JJ722 TaxID=3122973 RepID=UPI002FFE5600